MAPRACRDCGVDISQRRSNFRRCAGCAHEYAERWGNPLEGLRWDRVGDKRPLDAPRLLCVRASCVPAGKHQWARKGWSFCTACSQCEKCGQRAPMRLQPFCSECRERRNKRRRAHRARPEVKERQKEYDAARHARPEVKKRRRAYDARPEVKKRRRAHRARPEVKERRNERQRARRALASS